MRVNIVGGHYLTESMFIREGISVSPKADDADVLVFTGSTPVDASLYRQARLFPIADPIKDSFESHVYFSYRKEKSIIGINRGALLIHSLENRGIEPFMIGHSDNVHILKVYKDSREYRVLSNHSQGMLYTNNRDHVLACCPKSSTHDFSIEALSNFEHQPRLLYLPEVYSDDPEGDSVNIFFSFVRKIFDKGS